MNRNRNLWVMTIAFAVLVCTAPAGAAEGDVSGSADHPLIGRFENTRITWYKATDFDEYNFVTGAEKEKQFPMQVLEGKKTTIVYKTKEDMSFAEVIGNFKNRLQDKGFEISFICDIRESECSDRPYFNTKFAEVIETGPYLIPKSRYSRSTGRYLAAKKSKPDGNIYASIYTTVDNGNWIHVSVLEEAEIEDKMIDAAGMSKGILEVGHVALYSIYFDTDKAEVKAESRPTLNEIAKLLKKEPELSLVVVGHTDNQGEFDYNMDLSRRRAAAVAEALITDHGISGSRLKSWGAGFIAPVASNRTEEGRAKNRRVELVEQ